jgi:hypothetical protein
VKIALIVFFLHFLTKKIAGKITTTFEKKRELNQKNLKDLLESPEIVEKQNKLQEII